MIFTNKNDLKGFEDFVKIVVDIEEKKIALGCDLHIDCAEELLKNGSNSKNLWGANIYLLDKRIDFVSLINIRPSENNRTMEVEDVNIREQIATIVKEQLF
jgi:hypothetical protein